MDDPLETREWRFDWENSQIVANYHNGSLTLVPLRDTDRLPFGLTVFQARVQDAANAIGLLHRITGVSIS